MTNEYETINQNAACRLASDAQSVASIGRAVSEAFSFLFDGRCLSFVCFTGLLFTVFWRPFVRARHEYRDYFRCGSCYSWPDASSVSLPAEEYQALSRVESCRLTAPSEAAIFIGVRGISVPEVLRQVGIRERIVRLIQVVFWRGADYFKQSPVWK